MTMTIRLAALLTAVMTAVAALTLDMHPASAEGPDTAAATSLSLQKPRKGDGVDAIMIPARLSDADGNAIGNRAVTFFESADFFGERPADLGTVMTDATGTAILSYVPMREGDIEITARFAGDEALAPAETTSSIGVSEAATGYTPEPLQLEPLHKLAPIGAFLAAAAVWGVLALVVLRVVWSIRRTEPAPEASRVGWREGEAESMKSVGS